MKHTCVYPHVALLFQGRRLMAIGQNRAARRGPYNMIHAEADVIRNVGAARLRGGNVGCHSAGATVSVKLGTVSELCRID